MAAIDHRYTRQSFRSAAQRRHTEALAMVKHTPHRRKDGAVTAGLLAAECALKALILEGAGTERLEDLEASNKELHDQCFRGKHGHKLAFLYRKIDQPTKVTATEQAHSAIDKLNQYERYAWRYGASRTGTQASPALELLEHTQAILDWMTQELS